MLTQVIKCCCVYFLLSASLLDAQHELTSINQKLDSIFGHYDDGIQPGVSIAIIEKEKPVFFKSYGHANLEYQIKNTPHTLFNATDLAKQITIFSILLLQEEGKLSITDPVNNYIPELNEWPHEITLRHLMDQTSGLRDVMSLKEWSGYENGETINKQDILEVVANQQHLNFPSGTEFDYNRTGFVLLTEVVSKVSGISFSEYVQKHIFVPLGMDNSVFIDSHTALVPGRSYSYEATDNTYSKIVNNTSFIGGTNLYTSTVDFSKWLQNMAHPKIGQPSFYSYLHTKIELPEGRRSNYTAGIFKEDSEGYWRIHLEGFDHGFTGYMMYLPEYDFSLVYFSNDLGFPIDDINPKLWEWFNRDYATPQVKHVSLSDVTYTDKSRDELQSYTATYLFEDYYNVRNIEVDNDTLYYVRSKSSRHPIVPISGEHRFKMLMPEYDNIRVSFLDNRNIIEYRAVVAGETEDYVSHGRKINYGCCQVMAISDNFICDEINQSIRLENVGEELHLTLEDTIIPLDQINENEFLPKSSEKVRHVRLEKDGQQNVIGVYLTGAQVRNLYYRLISK